MMNISLPITTLTEQAVVPHNAYKGDAGYDLCAVENCVLQPFERALIPTGLAIAIPEGHAGLVVPRSGLAIKQGLSIVNAPGLIDSNYRGELKVIAINLDPKEPITISVGDRIAQLVIVEVAQVTFNQVEALDDSERGTGGFGSSGVSA